MQLIAGNHLLVSLNFYASGNAFSSLCFDLFVLKLLAAGAAWIVALVVAFSDANVFLSAVTLRALFLNVDVFSDFGCLFVRGSGGESSELVSRWYDVLL